MRGRVFRFVVPLMVPGGLLLLWVVAETILTRPFLLSAPPDEDLPRGVVSLAPVDPESRAYAQRLEALGRIGSRTFTVSADGSLLYFGVGRSMGILDVADPAHPVVLGQTRTLPGVPLQVSARLGYAFVTTGETGLRIFDVRNPAEPRELGSYKTAGDAVSVALTDGYAYVADTRQGLIVLDVSDLTAPRAVATHRISGIVRRIVVRDRSVFVVSTAGLVVLDASDPRSPRELGSYQGLGKFAQDVVLSGKYAYVADGDWGYGIFNVEDLTDLAIERLYDTPGVARGLALGGSHLFVADGPAGLRVYDLEDPLKPVEAGFYSIPGESWAVATAGAFAYVARGEAGLWAFRLAGP